jgi:hypothetical protein
MRFSFCELLLWEAGSWGTGAHRDPEEGERPELEAATEQQLGKTEYFRGAVVTVTFGVCNSLKLS